MNGETPLTAYAYSLLQRSGDAVATASKAVPRNDNESKNCATSVVYDLLTLSDRRKHGIFFSGSAWAQTLVSQLEVGRWKRFLDPSVGTGDLLVEICKQLPLAPSPKETLKDWSSRLAAVDLRESFLQIAWARIQAVAVARHRESGWLGEVPVLRDLPNSFRTGDALTLAFDLKTGDCVIMNPPYQLSNAPDSSFVGAGKRSAAAFHLEHVIKEAAIGVGIVALVPEVLRSGTSYRRFRNELSRRMDIFAFNSFGNFGPSADVDVAILHGITCNKPDAQDETDSVYESSVTIGTKYTIKVGPVVPHRTVKSDKYYGYLTAKNAPAWTEISEVSEMESYSTRLERGPFVVVKRTSSPSDKKRARASLILSKKELLVENHLIILRPNSGKVSDCRALLHQLEDPRTDCWLNEKIRCRHLTVSALKNIPWWT